MMILLYSFNILMGGCGEQIRFGKLVVLFKVKEKVVSFLKDVLYSSWYLKDKETWHLLHFDTLSLDIAVELMWDSLTRCLPEDWGNNVLELWAGLSEAFLWIWKKKNKE